MHLSQKQKTFSQMFCSFLKSTLRFQHLKKKMAFRAYLFPKFRILKNIDKYLRSLVSEDPSPAYMVNGLKHYFNLNDSSFTIFIAYCQGN